MELWGNVDAKEFGNMIHTTTKLNEDIIHKKYWLYLLQVSVAASYSNLLSTFLRLPPHLSALTKLCSQKSWALQQLKLKEKKLEPHFKLLSNKLTSECLKLLKTHSHTHTRTHTHTHAHTRAHTHTHTHAHTLTHTPKQLTTAQKWLWNPYVLTRRFTKKLTGDEGRNDCRNAENNFVFLVKSKKELEKESKNVE